MTTRLDRSRGGNDDDTCDHGDAADAPATAVEGGRGANAMVVSLATLLDQLTECVVVFGLDGACRYANAAAARLLDLDRAALVGPATPPAWVSARHATLWRFLSEWCAAADVDGCEVVTVDLELRAGDGRTVAVRMSCDPLLAPGGQAVCMVGILRAVVDEHDAGAELPRIPRDRRSRQASGGHAGASAWAGRLGELSDRESEVLHKLLDGKRIATISCEMFLSEHTVRNHLKAIYRKLGLHSLAELRERLTPSGRVVVIDAPPPELAHDAGGLVVP